MSFILSKSFCVTFAAAKERVYYTSRSISNCTWKGKPAYKTGSPAQQRCINHAFDAARVLGFDAKGAVKGEIAGGLHNRGSGPQWLTIQYTDSQGRIVYHQKEDGSIWNRIHVFDNPAINQTPAEKPVRIWAQ
ncbi:hypothetical protein F5887DRAFT_1079043 [Amanita rubescens]|nr:hypothetical protein F5887DRAFT_1079043 [Amanita rubescens]